MAAKVIQTRSFEFMKINGPGSIPWIWNIPKIMAVRAPPGKPKARSGIMAAPVAALLAVSEATTPSISPLPKLALREDHFCAWL